ncbi:hypothetical protein PVK06_040705 [Gossypium arboreum]|uniref:Uncharacterized protein n=1 Tax=Gossypium arboreum TaxID=29729 RepID=A0ABR0N688_GOSAR|nr:hypothetical protein PVK06_040705 [Gossypium arboreum]
MTGTLFVADFVLRASHTGSNSGVGRATKKATLLGSSVFSDAMLKAEEFEFQETDIMTKMMDEIPSITFLEWAYKFIE